MTARQLQRVPPVRLHPISRLLRYQRRCYHCAVDTQLGQLPVQYESCWPRFVAGAQLLRRTKLPDELADRIFAVGNRPQAAHDANPNSPGVIERVTLACEIAWRISALESSGRTMRACDIGNPREINCPHRCYSSDHDCHSKRPATS